MPDPVHDSPAWFEAIYATARSQAGRVPWDRHAPHPELAAWLARHPTTAGARAIVVGSGLGDDAEAVAAAGYATTAFDVSPSAVAGARLRHPTSTVNYQVADLLALPVEWHEAFDLVVEIWTVQAMPMALRERAIEAIGSLCGSGGVLLAIANSRPDHDVVPNGPPWPLSRKEVESFAATGLRQTGLRHDGFDRGTWVGTFIRDVS